jgi:hypothetical protein
MNQQFLMMVVGVSLTAGMLAGYFINAAKNAVKAKRWAQGIIHDVLQQSVQATTLVGGVACDVLIEHTKCTRDEAMQTIVTRLRKAGIEVSAYRVKEDGSVNKTF